MRPERKRTVLDSVPRQAVPKDWLYDNKGNLLMTGASLSVGLYHCHIAYKNKKHGEYVVNAEQIGKATGYSSRSVWTATNTLLKLPIGRKLIERRDGKDFTSNVYALYVPPGSSSLKGIYSNSIGIAKLLYAAQVTYDYLPTYLLTHLKELKGEPLQVLLTGLWMAKAMQQTKFNVKVSGWKKAAHISETETMRRAWNNPGLRALMHVTEIPHTQTVDVELMHPVTGDSLIGVRAEAEERADDRRLEYEAGIRETAQPKFTQQELEDWFKYEFPAATFNDSDGEWYLMCPKCKGTQGGTRAPHPTLRVRFDDPNYPVGKMTCRAHIRGRKDNEIFCSFDGAGMVPYFLVAMTHEALMGRQLARKIARQQMLDYIIAQRELKNKNNYADEERLMNG